MHLLVYPRTRMLVPRSCRTCMVYLGCTSSFDPCTVNRFKTATSQSVDESYRHFYKLSQRALFWMAEQWNCLTGRVSFSIKNLSSFHLHAPVQKDIAFDAPLTAELTWGKTVAFRPSFPALREILVSQS
jgi:hypothetical protein